METRGNLRTRVYEGDSCKVNSKLSCEDRLIEDHPQHLIENHCGDAAVLPITTARSSHWWAWLFAGIVGLCIICAGLYYAFGLDHNKINGVNNTQATLLKSNDAGLSNQVNGQNGYGIAGVGKTVGTENYVYYFGNDKSSVADNSVLDELADKVEETGADVTITAYASSVGNNAYNKNLSKKRAENVAGYLIAHGVEGSHVKVVSSGETTDYGDAAHNRRANIHVVYPG